MKAGKFRFKSLKMPETLDYSSVEILNLIGNTPMLRLELEEIPGSVDLMVKLESRNPGGSVKDRAARSIILDAIQSQKLKPGMALVDSTSGNTGIAYSMIGASLGVDVVVCVPGNASPAKLSLIEAMGADIVYTDPLEGPEGAHREAQSIGNSESRRYYFADQYSNPSNPRAHFLGTGPEILRQTYGRITHLVAGIGTGGTIMGLSEYFRSRKSGTKVIGVQPSSPIHGLEGLKHLDSSDVPPIFSENAIDDKVYVDTEDAVYWVERLATDKGLLIGPSSGAALCAAIETAQELDSGTVVAILPDAGERYLPFRSSERYEAFLRRQADYSQGKSATGQ